MARDAFAWRCLREHWEFGEVRTFGLCTSLPTLKSHTLEIVSDVRARTFEHLHLEIYGIPLHLFIFTPTGKFVSQRSRETSKFRVPPFF